MSVDTAQARNVKRLFSKTYLPGYTGHVPTKNDFFGMTTGSINKSVVANGGKEVSEPMANNTL
jgi:hypothetical protein